MQAKRLSIKLSNSEDAIDLAKDNSNQSSTSPPRNEPVSKIIIPRTPKTNGTSSASSSTRSESRFRNVRLAVNLSLSINIFILIAKVAVFVLTFSYAVVASLVDSVLDLLSQLIIWLTERKVQSKNDQKYPVGKTRLEPVGILTVSVLMIMLSVTVIRVSIQALATNSYQIEGSVIGIGLLTGVVFLKFCLWIYCRQFRHSPIAKALAQDHINDVFSNITILVVIFIVSYMPHLALLDPIGAICISFWIIWSWYSTGKDEVKKLVGRRADENTLEELKSICEDHHPDADLDVLRGYHVGRNIMLEVEMIMAKETTLEISHDVCMDLQVKLEEFDYVERAFVHCDYMHRGFDEHKQPSLS